MISTLEMSEAILKTWKVDGTMNGPDWCQHCLKKEQAPLWVITHSPDCIVLKCEHLKKMSTQHLMDDHPKSPPFVINWSQYNQFVGRIKRINVTPEPLEIEREQLREYHANAVRNLTKYADDSGLRESDVKHYRKRAAFHQTMVETIDKAMGEVN